MSDPAAPGGDPSSDASIARNSGLAFLAQLAGAAFTAGVTVFLARRLGTGGFGVFSLALGIGGLVLFPSDFGISASAARFVAEHRGDRARVASVVADSLRLKLLVSAAMAALLYPLATPIAAAYGTHALVWPIRAVAIALLGQSTMMLTSVFAALARVGFRLSTAIVESAVETTAIIALVLAGAGVTGAVFGRAIGFLVGGGTTVFLLVRLIGPGALPRGLRLGENTRRIATYGGVLLITDGAYTLFNQIDVLIIGAYVGTRAVGLFSAPMRLIAVLVYPGIAISAGVSPLLARNPRSEAGAPNIGAFLTALRVLLIVQAALTAFVLGWSTLIVRVALGSGYGKSAAVLSALAPFIFLAGFGALVSETVNYLGVARRRVPIAIATVTINFAVDLVLVPRIGVIGGSIGTDVAYGLYAPAHLLICQRVLRLDLRTSAKTLLRSLIAGAAMTGTLLLVGSSLNEAWRIPLGGLAGIAVFALVLWMTREVSASEAREALGHARFLHRLHRRGSEPG